MSPRRRRLLGAAALAGALPAACSRTGNTDPASAAASAADTRPVPSPAAPGEPLAERLSRALGLQRGASLSGGFVGPDPALGHRLRDEAGGGGAGVASSAHHVAVAIVGGGIAGLAAARALRGAGIDDYRIFELDAEVGGNSRAGTLAGFACPWGAHYLPAPDLDAGASGPAASVADFAPDGVDEQAQLRDLLREFGLLRGHGAAARYDDSALCQAPQERLLIDGHWQSGLLPLEGLSPSGMAQFQRFSELIDGFRRSGAFRIPSPPLRVAAERTRLGKELFTLERTSFAAWLAQQRLDDARLRWYLDYCCRDDFGVAAAQVSAWAGIHYFASRHGFELPVAAGAVAAAAGAAGAGAAADSSAQLLTWPGGNAWLVERLAAPHRDRTVKHAMVRQIGIGAADRRLSLQVRHGDGQRAETWSADFAILAVPLFIAARLLSPVPPALAALLPQLHYSAWQVANVHLPRLPAEKPGAPLSWDNVVYGSDALGFVDASHQLLSGHKTATVWTCYRALGVDAAARRTLLDRDWRGAAAAVLDDLRPAYPDIERQAARIDIVRWGHGMIAPTPGLRGGEAFEALQGGTAAGDRLVLAHGDLAGYSVFEESFAIGSRAGRRIARQISGSPRRR